MSGTKTSIMFFAIGLNISSWVNGAPTGPPNPILHSFDPEFGAPCTLFPCSLDMAITIADPATRYVVYKLTGTY